MCLYLITSQFQRSDKFRCRMFNSKSGLRRCLRFSGVGRQSSGSHGSAFSGVSLVTHSLSVAISSFGGVTVRERPVILSMRESSFLKSGPFSFLTRFQNPSIASKTLK